MMEYHWNGHSYDVTSYPNTLPKRKISVGDVLTTICISIFGLFLGSILCWGLHLEATYVVKGTVNSIEGNVVSFEVRDNIFECTATETESLNEGDEYWVKLTNEATESYPEDDHLIDFGTHHFLCFVWD